LVPGLLYKGLGFAPHSYVLKRTAAPALPGRSRKDAVKFYNQRVCTRHYDDMMYCHHSLYIPFCDECMKGEFKVPHLKEREPENANMGIQFLVGLYVLANMAVLIDNLPAIWDWLCRQ
jgi:hypothetical protein